MLTVCLVIWSSGVGCHIGGHFVGALAYANDVTLVAPSRSGIRTLINVCEQFALDYGNFQWYQKSTNVFK